MYPVNIWRGIYFNSRYLEKVEKMSRQEIINDFIAQIVQAQTDIDYIECIRKLCILYEIGTIGHKEIENYAKVIITRIKYMEHL